MRIETYNKLETIIHDLYSLLDMIESEANQSAMSRNGLPGDILRVKYVVNNVIRDLKSTKEYLKNVERDENNMEAISKTFVGSMTTVKVSETNIFPKVKTVQDDISKEEIKKLLEEYVKNDKLNIATDENDHLYDYLTKDYCAKHCKHISECDWVPMNCPIIQYKYYGPEAVKDIKNFDVETFNPIKYYWGEPQK